MASKKLLVRKLISQYENQPVPKFKIPKTPGAIVDRIFDLEQQAETAQHVVDKLDKERKFLENHLLDTLPKSDLEGLVGKTAVVKIRRTVVPQASDWLKVWAYAVKTKSPDLFQKRLSSEACRLRWEDGKVIPGVEQFTVVKLSVTKRS